MSRVFAADEPTVRTSLTQAAGQRQATHHVTGADLVRGVGAEYDMHDPFFLPSSPAAINDKIFAGHIGRCSRGQEQQGSDQFLGMPYPPQRDFAT